MKTKNEKIKATKKRLNFVLYPKCICRVTAVVETAHDELRTLLKKWVDEWSLYENYVVFHDFV